MTDETNLQGDASQSESNAETLNKEETRMESPKPPSNEDMVKWETYSRVMGKLKQREAEKAQMETELRSFKEQELLAKGSLEDALDLYKKKAETLQKELEDQQSIFAEKQFQLALNEAAVKEGVRPEAVHDVWLNLRDNYYEKVDLTDELNFDKTQIRGLISEFRETRPHWFSSGRQMVNDITPTEPTREVQNWNQHLASLSTQEKERLAVMNETQLAEYLAKKGIQF